MEGFCLAQKYSDLTSFRMGSKWLLYSGRSSYLAICLGGSGTIRTFVH